jgi:hypothetical protein
MSDDAGQRWQAKARWHAEQRSLMPAEKIKLILRLQLRESQLDQARVAVGQRPRGLKPWRTQA